LDAGEAASEASRLIPLPVASAISLPLCRVLVVDDGAENRQLIRLVLTKAGAKVEEAADGQEALDHIARQDYDLILMDMQMPVMDGYTATGRLRDSGVTVPIVALTANAMVEDEERCLKAGCSDFLAKPVNLDDLLRLVAKRLGPTEQKRAAGGMGGWGEVSPLMQEERWEAGTKDEEEKPHTAPVDERLKSFAYRATPAATLPAMDSAFAIEETIAALEGQLSELCQSYLGGDYEQVSVHAASLKQFVAKANHPALQSASFRLEENAVARNADGIEQAMTDITLLLQELQSSGKINPSHSCPPADRMALRSSMPMDDPVFREIVQGFVERLDSQIAAMEAAWQAGNDQELAFLAHWLKGAGGTMGFADFTAPAKRLEDSARSGDRARSALALEEIQRLAASILLE
jgi:CheY-like chemotaxis protein